MNNNENKVQPDTAIKYFCPMKCEGSKTYDKPGDCPVCNMHLVPVDDKNQSTENHHGHNHGHNHGHHHGGHN